MRELDSQMTHDQQVQGLDQAQGVDMQGVPSSLLLHACLYLQDSDPNYDR